MWHQFIRSQNYGVPHKHPSSPQALLGLHDYLNGLVSSNKESLMTMNPSLGCPWLCYHGKGSMYLVRTVHSHNAPIYRLKSYRTILSRLQNLNSGEKLAQRHKVQMISTKYVIYYQVHAQYLHWHYTASDNLYPKEISTRWLSLGQHA